MPILFIQQSYIFTSCVTGLAKKTNPPFTAQELFNSDSATQIQYLHCPPQSTSLNPIEKVWEMLERHIRQQSPCAMEFRGHSASSVQCLVISRLE
ncbi:hypothetical protein AVEN_103004-1 [Araneus ventricosus]|uniref:Tc1-like transposase DDE domain-containing protein n=1 Tax=Araneus ventricosus TaxID=182803 RepID=A0A4Y2B8I8_ARAVE|nr:hypothetical protein AVEN_103004-1 [Araneus ventricosus]